MPFRRYADNRDASHRPLWGTYDGLVAPSQHLAPPESPAVERSSVDSPASPPRINQDLWTWSSSNMDLALPSIAQYSGSDSQTPRQTHDSSQDSSGLENGSNVLDDPHLYRRHLQPEATAPVSSSSSSLLSAELRLSSLLGLPSPEPEGITRGPQLSLYSDEAASQPLGGHRTDLPTATATQPSAMRATSRPFAVARPILSNASAIEPEFSTAGNSSRPSSASATIKRNFDAIAVSPPSTVSSSSRQLLHSTDNRGEGSSSSATRASLAPSANIAGRGRTVHKRHRTVATDDLENISADDAVGSNGLNADDAHTETPLLARAISFPPALGVNFSDSFPPDEQNGFADSILRSPPFLQSDSTDMDEDEPMTALLSDDTEAPLLHESTQRPVREPSPPRPTLGWSSTVSTEPSTTEARSSPRHRNVSAASTAIINAFGPDLRSSRPPASSAASPRPIENSSAAPSEGPSLGGDLSAAASSWLILVNDFKLRLEQLTYDVQSATDQFAQWRISNPSRTAGGTDSSSGRATSARTGTGEWQELQSRLREVQILLEGGSQRIALASRLLPEGQGSTAAQGAESGDGDASLSVDTVTPSMSSEAHQQPATVGNLPALNLSLSEDGLLGETLSTAVERAGLTAASSTFDVHTDIRPSRRSAPMSTLGHLRAPADLAWPRSSAGTLSSGTQTESRNDARVSVPRLPLVRSGSPLSFSFSPREDEQSRSASNARIPLVSAVSLESRQADVNRTPRRLRASGNLREFRMARINNATMAASMAEQTGSSSPASPRSLPPPVHGTRQVYHTNAEDSQASTQTPRDSFPRQRPSISSMRRRWQPPILPPRTSSTRNDEDSESLSDDLLAGHYPAYVTAEDNGRFRVHPSLPRPAGSTRTVPSASDRTGYADALARSQSTLRSRYDEFLMARAEEAHDVVSGRRRYGPYDWAPLTRESGPTGDASQASTASEATSSDVTVSVRPHRVASRNGQATDSRTTSRNEEATASPFQMLPVWDGDIPALTGRAESDVQAMRLDMAIPRYRRGCPKAVIDGLNVFVYATACDAVNRSQEVSPSRRDRKGKGKAREDEEMEVERAISSSAGQQQRESGGSSSQGSSSPGSSSDTSPSDDATSKTPRRPLDHACSICLDEYESDSRLAETSWCGHSFHEDCLKQWLNQSRGCPLCRQEPNLIHPTRARAAAAVGGGAEQGGRQELWRSSRRYDVNPWPPRRRDRLASMATAEAILEADREFFGNSSAASLLSELG